MGNGKFYRARKLIISRYTNDHFLELSAHQIHIVFIDFGSSEWTKSKYLHPLQTQFVRLPAQAISCSLDRVGLQNNNEEKKDIFV